MNNPNACGKSVTLALDPEIGAIVRIDSESCHGFICVTDKRPNGTVTGFFTDEVGIELHGSSGRIYTCVDVRYICTVEEWKISVFQDWADQYQAEVEKQAADRAATLEGLFRAGDFEACHDWLFQWEAEDKAPDSVGHKYRQTLQTLTMLRLERQGSSEPNAKASADSLRGSSADSDQTTAMNES